jgi:hypothetical protein
VKDALLFPHLTTVLAVHHHLEAAVAALEHGVVRHAARRAAIGDAILTHGAPRLIAADGTAQRILVAAVRTATRRGDHEVIIATLQRVETVEAARAHVTEAGVAGKIS